jgi:hypothetical protein
MTPLARVAWGFLIVVIDFRVDGFDVVADPLGWVLVLAGLLPLAGRSGWLTAAAVAAGAGFLLSIPQALAEPGPGLAAVHGLVETVLVFGTCTGIMQLVADRPRATANRIRWADLGIVSVGILVGLASGEDTQVSGGAAGLVLLLVLAALAVMAWFAIFLLGIQRHPGLAARPRVPA